jgi:N-acetylmuramoyl-L-alanine amidase
MGSPEYRNIVSSGVAAAVKEFCDYRWTILGPL